MKKTTAILLVFVICLWLCACREDTKSTEAQKADELILAIGEVTADNEPAIWAAQAYYNTLTEEQKAEVENYNILVNSLNLLPKKNVLAQKADDLILAIGDVSLERESAILVAKGYYDTLTDDEKAEVENIAVLDSAVQNLDGLKLAEEYKEIYSKALEYETNLNIDKAYAEYKKLPADYEDVTKRMIDISPLVGVAGTWHCENFTAISNKGTELGVLFKTITISISSIKDGNADFSYTGVSAGMQHTNSSIITGHADLLFMLDNIGTWGGLQSSENGSWILGTTSCGKTNFGVLTITYSVTAENTLIVEYSLKNNDDITSVAYTYRKPQ